MNTESQPLLASPDQTTPAPAPTPTPTPQVTPPIPQKPANAVPQISSVLGTLDRLTEAQQIVYITCNMVIQDGWRTFVEVGLALARIRDDDLFRDEYGSFEAYYRDKWGYEHAQVYYLMSAAQVFTRLVTLPDVRKPETESQVRPLTALTPEAALQAWQSASAKAGAGRITARLVKSAVKELTSASTGQPKPEKQHPRQERAQQKQAIGEIIGQVLKLLSDKAAYNVVIDRVQVLDHHLQRLFALDRARKKS